MAVPHIFRLVINYEDTDFSGVVYHANYFRYFERARGDLLGVQNLLRLYQDTGIGFAVYRAEVHFKEGARYGDRLEIRTVVTKESDYRLICDQSVWREGGTAPLVKATIQMVCVNQDQKLVPIPGLVVALLDGTHAG